MILLLAVLAAMAVATNPALPQPGGTAEPAAAGKDGAGRAPVEAGIQWRRSTAVGRAFDGRLVGGVQLPEEGAHFFSWDGRDSRRPNPPDRRWGTAGLVRTVLRVCAEFRAANPDAPRCAVGDLSRRDGGPFGREFGGDGHRSHQNGLDVDVYYPRKDGKELAPSRVAQVDRALAQDLVDRFVAAGAEFVFVGPRTGLRGPEGTVQALSNHDDHLHLRLKARHANRD